MERAFKEDGCPWYAIARHMLGLYHGERGGRLWRQVWSNHKLKPQPPREVMHLAREALARGAEVPAKEVPVLAVPNFQALNLGLTSVLN
jgi:tRNA-dihydrouridine synthase A